MSYIQMIGTYVVITGLLYRSPSAFLWPVWMVLVSVGFATGFVVSAANLIKKKS